MPFCSVYHSHFLPQIILGTFAEEIAWNFIIFLSGLDKQDKPFFMTNLRQFKSFQTVIFWEWQIFLKQLNYKAPALKKFKLADSLTMDENDILLAASVVGENFNRNGDLIWVLNENVAVDRAGQIVTPEEHGLTWLSQTVAEDGHKCSITTPLRQGFGTQWLFKKRWKKCSARTKTLWTTLFCSFCHWDVLHKFKLAWICVTHQIAGYSRQFMKDVDVKNSDSYWW